MNLNIVFRILSFVLMPIAILLGMVDILALSAAMANPQMLLPVFIVATVVMYTFSSFRFYRSGIIGGKTFSKKTKDFIKVNGYVALGFSILSLVQGFMALFSKKAIQQMLDTYKKMAEANAISGDKATNVLYVSIAISIIFSLILISHIVICFKFLKQYENKFVD